MSDTEKEFTSYDLMRRAFPKVMLNKGVQNLKQVCLLTWGFKELKTRCPRLYKLFKKYVVFESLFAKPIFSTL